MTTTHQPDQAACRGVLSEEAFRAFPPAARLAVVVGQQVTAMGQISLDDVSASDDPRDGAD